MEPEDICVNPGRDECEFIFARGILEYVGHRVMLGPRQQTSSRPYFLSVFYWGTVFSLSGWLSDQELFYHFIHSSQLPFPYEKEIAK